MKSLIRLVLVIAIGLALGYIFQPTIDTKLAEKSPKLKTWVMKRQADWNTVADSLLTKEETDTVNTEKIDVIKETINDNNVGDSHPNVSE